MDGSSTDGTALVDRVPSVATIVDRDPKNAPVDLLHPNLVHRRITAGQDFLMGAAEKLTVLQDLTIKAGTSPTAVDPRVVLSDLSAFRDMRVEIGSGTILLQSRSRSNVLADDGNADALDKGLDYFAVRNLVFIGKHFQVETRKANAVAGDFSDKSYQIDNMSANARTCSSACGPARSKVHSGSTPTPTTCGEKTSPSDSSFIRSIRPPLARPQRAGAKDSA